MALVPTMGALHEGHLSLVRLARGHAERVVASVFVNPRQFGPAEDFDAYPRSEAADLQALASVGCDLLYAPTLEAMYPPGFSTTVDVGGVSEGLCGGDRPGHFSGVATVVAKLLLQTRPDAAVFGEKDWQQLCVIRRLTQDLDLDVEIVAAPIVRASDGLALSSRNAYLASEERRAAPTLYRVLRAAADAIARGAQAEVALAEGLKDLQTAGMRSIDYIELREADSLGVIGPGFLDRGVQARLLAAVYLGRTRLIDNVAVRRG